MHWNHRVVRSIQGEATVWEICEVYYDETGEPHLRSDAVDVGTTSQLGGPASDEEAAAEMAETLDRMRRCLDLPFLDASTFATQGNEG